MGKGEYKENYKPYENWRKSKDKKFSKIMEEFCRIQFQNCNQYNKIQYKLRYYQVKKVPSWDI